MDVLWLYELFGVVVLDVVFVEFGELVVDDEGVFSCFGVVGLF